jgi:hypothetical protein
MNTLLKRLRFVVALFFAVALTACASAPKIALHTFTCNGYSDSNRWIEKVDLLAYSYGDQGSNQLRDTVENPRTKWLLDNVGKTSLSCGGVVGYIPVGDFLYVKWRIKETDEVLEERVDLKERLPQKMDHHKLTFSIDERQLHVYVVTPFPRYDRNNPDHNLPGQRVAGPYETTHLTFYSRTRWTYEIYPTLESYPEPTNLTLEQKQRCLKGETLCNLDKSKK